MFAYILVRGCQNRIFEGDARSRCIMAAAVAARLLPIIVPFLAKRVAVSSGGAAAR